ncbi:MAG: flavin reductase family protein [Anaerolineales bacterium]|nr:flavin reductase family protein [Anaerolineales bacterium]
MKIKFGATPLIYPIPIILAGANVNGKPNFATLGDCGIMGIRPPLVYVSLNRDHYTTQGILENRSYSINLPTTEMLAITDYCGIVSGKDVDKSNLFEIFYGELGTAPLIEKCPVNLECRVVKEFAIQHRHIFVGEVVQTYVEKKFVRTKNGRLAIAALTRLDPIIYALDNRYYNIGKAIGVGYTAGKSLRRKS